MRARPAFTLLELLVVIVIIGVLAAVAAPALRRRGGADAAAQELASVYEAARERALSRGTYVAVVLDLTTGSYRVLSARRPDAFTDTVRVGRLERRAGAALAGGRAGWARLSFDPLGRARGDRVTVADNDQRYEVVADAWTGAVRTRPR